MAKPLGKAAPQRSALQIPAYKWERLPDGQIRYTHTPPSLSEIHRYKWRPIYCAGFDVDDQGKRHYHHLDCIPCHCRPGPQMLALWAAAFEVALGGGRGSAKSEATFGFLSKGNTISLEAGKTFAEAGLTISGVDLTYLNSPDYKFLVLRKNAKDLKDYYERAKRYFQQFGGDMVESPQMGVRFPSGAWGIFDHLADNDAWEKYQGQEFTRIVLEEASQIQDEINYLKILMSCRSPKPELKEQIMLTANPGGRGANWFNARFFHKHADGTPYLSGEVYEDPLVDDLYHRSRVLILSTVEDNPYQMAKGYDKQLELLKERQPTLYARWRHGDFSAVEGQYFEAFRDMRRANEPPQACHVIEPVEIGANWPRAIGVDWGYSHPAGVIWGAWSPKEQLHVYREKLQSRTSTVQLGAEIAQASIADLEKLPGHHMNIYLSHDAFSRTDEGPTEADQIAKGINMVLGEDSAFVLSLTEEEELLENQVAWNSVYRRRREMQRKTHLTLVNAGRQRKSGWNLIREYLRWWPAIDQQTAFNPEVAKQIIQTQGALAYLQYKQETEKKLNEILPKILFHLCRCGRHQEKGVPRLVEWIPSATESENDSEDVEKQDGDDIGDAWRHLCTHFLFQEAEITKDAAVAEKIRVLQQENPGLSTFSLIMAARTAEYQHDRKSHGHGFVRHGGPVRRVMAAMQARMQ